MADHEAPIAGIVITDGGSHGKNPNSLFVPNRQISSGISPERAMQQGAQLDEAEQRAGEEIDRAHKGIAS